MTIPYNSSFRKIAPRVEYRNMKRDSEFRCKSYQRYKHLRSYNAEHQLDHIKLLSSPAMVLIIMCSLITLTQSDLKVVRHTFEEGLDDWKVDNQSWLRLPFSRLKQNHPNLAVPTQLNSTVRIIMLYILVISRYF